MIQEDQNTEGSMSLNEEYLISKRKEAKFYRDKHILEAPGHKLADGTPEGRATAIHVAGISPENYDKIVGKPKEEKTVPRIIFRSKFSPVPYAEDLMKRYRFLFDRQNILWRYSPEKGIWLEDGESLIKSLLRKEILAEEEQKTHYCKEIVEYIKGLIWTDKDMTNQPTNLIAFENVLYDLDKEEFVDFSPDYFLINKLPITLDSENRDYDKIDFFLEEIVGKEKKKTLYELMAYCLYRGYPYQKFFILYGGGNNGKSAFLNLLIKLLGFHNISNKKPQALVADKFASFDLYGKLANISPDIPYSELEDSSVIRELTGDDPIDAQKKYGQAFKFFNYAKIIFSANELPQVKDRTYAFDRRIYIIQFNKNIEKKHQDPKIVDKISDPKEISGLGWYLLSVLKDLKKRNWKFSYDPDEKEMALLYEELSNSLSRFIKEACKKEKDTKIPDFELKARFSDWCSQKGFREWRVTEINTYMREKFQPTRMSYDFWNKDTGKFDVKFIRAWEGLTWK